MLGVVPAKETDAVHAGMLEGAEAVGKVRPVLERLELRFGIGIVVRDRGTRMRFRDTEIRQEQRDRLRRHRRAAIGVDRALARHDPVPRAARGDERRAPPPALPPTAAWINPPKLLASGDVAQQTQSTRFLKLVDRLRSSRIA